MAGISELRIIDYAGTPTAVVRASDLHLADMPGFMDPAMRALGRAMQAGVFSPAGPAFARYDAMDGEVVTVEVGFPVHAAVPQSIEQDQLTIEPSLLPRSTLATVTYAGGYDGLGRAWGEFMEAVRAEGWTPTMPFWEVYETEPTPQMDPADLRTGLAVPVIRED